MSRWLIKSAIQHVISWLPASQRWNLLFQKHVTHSLELPAVQFEARLNCCRQHLENYRKAASGIPAVAMEVGSGWFPLVPLGLWLCGVEEVWTFDIEPLLSTETLKKTLSELLRALENGTLARLLPEARAERLRILRGLTSSAGAEKPAAVLARLHIHARVQGAQETGIPANKVDLFFSTGVLEYIPRPVLVAILRESGRVGTSNCVHSHYINMEDQYSTFDRSITAFNFLKYTERQWRWLDSPLASQNRLRVSDFREAFTESGFEVVFERSTSGNRAELENLQLAPSFRKYRTEDLLVVNAWLVSRRG